MQESATHWSGPGLTRIPYGVYSDPALAAQEQSRIFRGPVWNYLCLEADLVDSGSYRTTFAGETPVIVVRDDDNEIYAFENRCAHRGALIALEKSGKAENFQCVYHAWSYNRQGDLTGVAFEKGVKGQGGMSAQFSKEDPTPLAYLGADHQVITTQPDNGERLFHTRSGGSVAFIPQGQ